jgi:hypothetical protein
MNEMPERIKAWRGFGRENGWTENESSGTPYTRSDLHAEVVKENKRLRELLERVEVVFGVIPRCGKKEKCMVCDGRADFLAVIRKELERQ